MATRPVDYIHDDLGLQVFAAQGLDELALYLTNHAAFHQWLSTAQPAEPSSTTPTTTDAGPPPPTGGPGPDNEQPS